MSDYEEYITLKSADKMAEKTFKRAILTSAELRKLDSSKLQVAKPSERERAFEVVHEVPPVEYQTDQEKKYWSLRVRTKLPEPFWNMAWINVSNMLILIFKSDF
jgi:hypothetical protein